MRWSSAKLDIILVKEINVDNNFIYCYKLRKETTAMCDTDTLPLDNSVGVGFNSTFVGCNPTACVRIKIKNNTGGI